MGNRTHAVLEPRWHKEKQNSTAVRCAAAADVRWTVIKWVASAYYYYDYYDYFDYYSDYDYYDYCDYGEMVKRMTAHTESPDNSF